MSHKRGEKERKEEEEEDERFLEERLNTCEKYCLSLKGAISELEQTLFNLEGIEKKLEKKREREEGKREREERGEEEEEEEERREKLKIPVLNLKGREKGKGSQRERREVKEKEVKRDEKKDEKKEVRKERSEEEKKKEEEIKERKREEEKERERKREQEKEREKEKEKEKGKEEEKSQKTSNSSLEIENLSEEEQEKILQRELEKMRVMEARKYQFYFWFRNLVIFISLVNYFLIPFQFAFLSGNEEAHTFLFFYYLGMYLLNGANWYVVRLQVEDELHQKMSLKLGNSYIRGEMKKLCDKNGGEMPVDELARVIRTFPETGGDVISNEDLSKFVKEEMDLNGDGTIDWMEMNLFLTRAKAAIEAKESGESPNLFETQNVINSPMENILVILPFGLMQQTIFLLFLQFGRTHIIYREVIEMRPKSWRPNYFRLATLGVLTFYIAHWVGCVWFIVGAFEGYGSNEWVPSVELMEASITTKYLQAFYWGFVNGMAIDHTAPETNFEVLVVLTLLLVGLSMFATVIGNISSLLTEFDTDWLELQSKMDDLMEYMEEKELPEELQTRVLNHYRYKWKKGRVTDDTTIESELPISLRTDIALYLHKDALEKIPLFRNTSAAFKSVLVRMMKPSVCAPGEYVVKFGDIGREMYFLQRGVCTVMNASENIIYAVFTSGAFFGEFALLFSQRRTATIKANTYCDLFTLSQEDFQSVLQDFPEFESLIKREGLKPVVSKFKVYPKLCTIGYSSSSSSFLSPRSPSKSFLGRGEEGGPLLDLFVSKLKPRMLGENRYVFRQGMGTKEQGDGIFFISKGTVVLEDEEDYTLFTIVEGNHFGHSAVGRNERRALKARAATECQTFVLSQEAYESIVCQFPTFPEMLEHVCEDEDYFD